MKKESEIMELDHRLVVNLRNLGHAMRFLFGGKGSQKRILSILLEHGPMTQREMTERVGIQPGSASEVIGKLESAGLIERVPSRTDRRTADILLTKKGEEQAKEAVAERRRLRQEMFACLTEEEKDQLLHLTEKLNADWDRRYGEKMRQERLARGGMGHHRGQRMQEN